MALPHLDKLRAERRNKMRAAAEKNKTIKAAEFVLKQLEKKNGETDSRSDTSSS